MNSAEHIPAIVLDQVADRSTRPNHRAVTTFDLRGHTAPASLPPADDDEEDSVPTCSDFRAITAEDLAVKGVSAIAPSDPQHRAGTQPAARAAMMFGMSAANEPPRAEQLDLERARAEALLWPDGGLGMVAPDPDEPEATPDRGTRPNHRAISSFDLAARGWSVPAERTAPWDEAPLVLVERAEPPREILQSLDAPAPRPQPAPGSAPSLDPDAPAPAADEVEEASEPRPRLYASAPEAASPEVVSRRRFLFRGAAAALVAGAGVHAWGRRPLDPPTERLRPGAFKLGEYRTMIHAFEAILGDPSAARRAAYAADLHYSRLQIEPHMALVRDLRRLEMGPRGLFDSRRFTRLSTDEAGEVLASWRTSALASRRRMHAELQRLARYGWASHPASQEQLHLATASRLTRKS